MIDARGQQRTAGDEQLANNQHQGESQHELPLRDQRERVDQHADSDEEQRRKDIPDRNDVGEHLLFEVRLGDNDPCQEGPETERQSGRMRGQGNPKGDGHDGEHEELSRASPRNHSQQWRHKSGAEEKRRDQNHRRDQERFRDAEAATALAGDDGDEREHRRQAEILDDTETERHPGMRALHLSPAQEHL